jgi:hypothetical protein
VAGRAPSSAIGSSVALWLALSLLYCAVFCALALSVAFASPYVIQDDARQFVTWTERFLDPRLFPTDPIADYFLAVSPPGYLAVYRMAALVGIDPWLLSKLLPALLALAATYGCYRWTVTLLPRPIAGFLACVLLNQALWSNADVVSATPRAFLYPLFLAFLFFAALRAPIGIVVSVGLLGLFYPHMVLLALGVLALGLIDGRHWPPRLDLRREVVVPAALALAVGLLVVLPFASSAAAYGPTVTGAEALRMPEFQSEGRVAFFTRNDEGYWLYGQRSGVLPHEWWDRPVPPLHLFAGALLPLLLVVPRAFPLGRQVSRSVDLLPRLLVVSLALFGAAHVLLFQLHLPNRYTQHSLRIVLAVAAALVLTIVVDAAMQWARRWTGQGLGRGLALLVLVLVGGWSLAYPVLIEASGEPFMNLSYQEGIRPELYEFFARQPTDVVIASLDEEANNIPAFSKRSVLVGKEFALPYHSGYYAAFSERALGLMRAQYSPNLRDIQQYIRTYDVDYLMIGKSAFDRGYVSKKEWMRQLARQAGILEALENEDVELVPALEAYRERCAEFKTGGLIVLDARCVAEARSS